MSASQSAHKKLVALDYVLYASPLLTALLVYGYSISLPFFLDDGPHFRILAATNGLQQWGDFPAFPFYRPVAFSIWKVFEAASGGFDPVALHLLNVFVFGMAGVLIGQITRRIAPAGMSRIAAIFAGTLFITAPFSYQAVAMVAALFHLTLTLGIVGCLWLALLWLDGRIGSVGLIACWACAFAAIFSHENGVLLPVLLVGIITAVYWKAWPPLKRVGLIVLPVVAIAMLYGVLWLIFRPQEGGGLTEDFDVALAALLQGLIYPFARLVRPLVTGDIGAGMLLALVVAVIILALGVVHWRRPDASRLMLYGLGWYLLAILPAALLLSAGYVLGQLRLSLLASAGGAIFWGVALATLWHITPRALKIIPAALMILFLYVSFDFLGMRRADFLWLRDYNREMLALLDTHDIAASRAVLVNAPDYITPDESNRRFLLGTEGVLFVDQTLDYNQQFWLNSDIEYSTVEVIRYRQIQRNEGFGFRAHPPDLESVDVIQHVQNIPYVFITQFEGRRFFPVLVGGTALEGSDEAIVEYPEVDFSLTEAQAVVSGDRRTVTTWVRWWVGQPAPVKLFIHITCGDALIAQSDGYPWGDTYPFNSWSPGEVRTDIRQIPLDTPIEPDCLYVYVGLYREADVTRLQAFDAGSDTRFENDLFPVPIQFESNEAQ